VFAGWVTVGNMDKKKTILTKFKFDEIIQAGKLPIFKFGTVKVKLDDKLFEKWKTGGMKGDNIKVLDDQTIRILGTGAFIENITFEPCELDNMNVTLEPFNLEPPTENNIFELNLIQFNHDGKNYAEFGGEVFIFKSLKEK